MNIGKDNYARGNQAMASVLLLYYHMLQDSGFANDQTVYVERLFSVRDYLQVEVSNEYQAEIDQELLREGAVIYLLCGLNDAIGEYEYDFLLQASVQTIHEQLTVHGVSVIPEVAKILKLLESREQDFDFPAFKNALSHIYQQYVVLRFAALLSN